MPRRPTRSGARLARRSVELVLSALVLSAVPGCLGRPADASDPVNPAALPALGAAPTLLSAAVERLTEVMVTSVTSPPVAARTYAYASVAAYEALRPAHPRYRTLAGQVDGLEPVPVPPGGEEDALSHPLAGVVAFLTVAERLVFDPASVAAHRDSTIRRVREAGAPGDVVERSVAYGDEVARAVLAWASGDGLARARALPRFEVRDEPWRWRPTPPAYMDAVEPNWRTLRPFVMTSATELRPAPPVPYDDDGGSAFHEQVLAVYRAGLELDDERRAIARFWDCNPFALSADGHYMAALKKITPGGHWMGITGIALELTGADLMAAAEAYALVAIALADGFLSAWDMKYETELVRPETLINEWLDPTWRPLLQTPPFPEYPSAHSVISAAAAEVLTDLFGDDLAFRDDVEVGYGLPVRAFPSFRAAAGEAAVSRLYGGIHYPMAVENGAVQGRQLGEAVVTRLETRAASFAGR